MGAARWLALLAVVTSSETACHSPKTSTSYVHEPPVASFRRPALAEVVTTMAVVGVWGGGSEASLAAFLGSLGAALPRATVSVVAAPGAAAAAARVAARFPSQAARVVEAAGDAWRAGARLLGGSGAALLTDADGVSFQSAALRDTVAGASGCAAFDAGATRSLLGAGDAVRDHALGGGPCGAPAAHLFWSPAAGCGAPDAYGRVAPSRRAAPYLALHGSAPCAWRAAHAARLATFAATCAAPPCAAPLSRAKNAARTRALLKAHGLANDGSAAARAARAARPDLFADPAPSGAPPGPCLLMGAGDYAAPAPYATFLRSLRESGCACDVALFTRNASDAAVRRVFADFGANWLEFFPTDVPGATVDDLRAGAFATLPGRGRAASTFRFRLFHAYVTHFGGRYGRVGWVDVRDVYAQGDVFAAAPGAGLAVFTETAVFSLRHKRKVYLDWSRHSWGYDCDPAYETYDSLPPVNLGVVLGDPPSVLAALERLVCDLEACGGWDQFVFSKLVYTTEKARVYTTDDGPVADPRRAAPTLCDASAAPGAGREPVLEPRGARGRRGRGAQRRRAALRPRPPVGPLRRARRARRGAVPLRRRVGPLSPAGDGDGEEVRGDDDGAAEVGPGGVREGGEVAGLVARREVPERERRRSRGGREPARVARRRVAAVVGEGRQGVVERRLVEDDVGAVGERDGAALARARRPVAEDDDRAAGREGRPADVGLGQGQRGPVGERHGREPREGRAFERAEDGRGLRARARRGRGDRGRVDAAGPRPLLEAVADAGDGAVVQRRGAQRRAGDCDDVVPGAINSNSRSTRHLITAHHTRQGAGDGGRGRLAGLAPRARDGRGEPGELRDREAARELGARQRERRADVRARALGPDDLDGPGALATVRVEVAEQARQAEGVVPVEVRHADGGDAARAEPARAPGLGARLEEPVLRALAAVEDDEAPVLEPHVAGLHVPLPRRRARARAQRDDLHSFHNNTTNARARRRAEGPSAPRTG